VLLRRRAWPSGTALPSTAGCFLDTLMAGEFDCSDAACANWTQDDHRSENGATSTAAAASDAAPQPTPAAEALTAALLKRDPAAAACCVGGSFAAASLIHAPAMTLVLVGPGVCTSMPSVPAATAALIFKAEDGAGACGATGAAAQPGSAGHAPLSVRREECVTVASWRSGLHVHMTSGSDRSEQMRASPPCSPSHSVSAAFGGGGGVCAYASAYGSSLSSPPSGLQLVCAPASPASTSASLHRFEAGAAPGLGGASSAAAWVAVDGEVGTAAGVDSAQAARSVHSGTGQAAPEQSEQPQRPQRTRRHTAAAGAAALARGVSHKRSAAPALPAVRLAPAPCVGHRCSQCSAASTPVWRAGPNGPKTLCNACGVRWAKVAKTRK
jgi:hypothetical protein